jgi:hypothetical protein
MLDDRSLRVPDTGTLLNESFWLFRKNFALLVTISAAFFVPYAMFGFASSPNSVPQMQTPGSWLDFMRMTGASLGTPEQPQGLWGWLYRLVCHPLAGAAIIAAITERYAQRNSDARTSIAVALPFLVELSIAHILLGLLLVALAIPAMLCGLLGLNMWISPLWSGFLTPRLPSGITIPMILVGIVGLAFLLLPVVVSLRLAFVSQLVVLEQLGPVKSIVRSWELSSGYTWRLLRLGIVIVVLEFIVVRLPVAVLAQGIAVSTHASEAGWIIGMFITKIFDIVVFPFSIIVYTLLFYSLSLQAMQHDGETLPPTRPFVLPTDKTAYDDTGRLPSA